LRCFFVKEDGPILDAPWWRGKQVSIIAVDIDGNFFFGIAAATVLFGNIVPRQKPSWLPV
jgi:hypothetical protein